MLDGEDDELDLGKCRIHMDYELNRKKTEENFGGRVGRQKLEYKSSSVANSLIARICMWGAACCSIVDIGGVRHRFFGSFEQSNGGPDFE